MSKKHWPLTVICIPVALALLLWLLTRGHTWQVLSPAADIGQRQRQLMYFALLLSLVVVLPVFALAFVVAWRYRAGNTRARYTPDADRSWKIEALWWGVPTILIAILSWVAWQSSHALDPYRPYANAPNPLTVQVVALDWKWLFVYPDQHVASVNFLQLPQHRPVDFYITSDAPMNSFWIPQLAGQVYAMPGMSTQLHLMANKVGDYHGLSANISGEGFAGMQFTARVGSAADFAAWARAAQHAPQPLNSYTYAALALPSKNNQPAQYTLAQPNLYDTIVMKYMMPAPGGTTAPPHMNGMQM